MRPVNIARPLGRLRLWSLATSLLVVSLLVAACAQTATPQSGASTAPSGPHRLVVAAVTLPSTLDPQYAPGGESAEISINLYERLYTWRVKNDASGYVAADTEAGAQGIVGALVDTSDVSADGKVYTLHLRKGVKSAAGNELTADDVKFSIERMLRTKGPGPFIAGVASIKSGDQVQVVDPSTVRITLPAPNANFTQVFFIHFSSVTDSKVVKQHATTDDPWATNWLKTNDAGFGPYTVKEFTSGSQVVLVPNPNYYGKKPYFDEVVYRQVPDASQRLLLVKQGDVDVAKSLTVRQLDSLQGDTNIQQVSVMKNLFDYVALGTTIAPTNNKKVRQALQYAIPQANIIKTVYNGKAQELRNTIPPSYPVYDASAWPFTYDPDTARRMLADAGFPAGTELKVLVDSNIPELQDIAVLIQDSLAKIGVKSTIDQKPTAAYRDDAANKEIYHLVVAQTYSLVIDVCYHMVSFISKTGSVSFNHYAYPPFDALTAKCNSLPNGPERDGVLRDLQKMVADEIPTLSVAVAPGLWAIRSGIKGFTWTPYNQIRFSDLSK